MTSHYYSTTQVKKTAEKEDCKYIVVYGKRSNGKTFGFVRDALNAYLENGYHSRYLRRFAESIKKSWVTDLVTPHVKYLERMTDGKYNGFKYTTNRFYPCKYDDNGKIEYQSNDPFLFCNSLSNWETMKGADCGKCNYVLFDEFMTRERYLPDEFVLFSNYVSSVVRDRTDTTVVLIGNTVSRDCPILQEMGINPFNIKQGSIAIVRNRQGKTTAVVEYCENNVKNPETEKNIYFAFDNNRLDMITSGSWETGNYPHPDRGLIKLSENICTVGIKFRQIPDFCLDYRMTDDLFFILVRPCYDASDCDLYLTDSYDHTWNSLAFWDMNNSALQKLPRVFADNRMYFSSNEIGENYRIFTQNFPNFPPSCRIK